jgi:quinol monooxygenase YgiN
MSADFAVIVSFSVKPEARQNFMALVRDNARQSVSTEPGCMRFDIVEPPGQPDDVWLYEIYSDRAAFDMHLKLPHFLSFDAATRDMVAAKLVISGRLEENANA